MSLADRIEADIRHELREFMEWMAENWKDEADDGEPIPDISKDPRTAFSEGWNRAAASMTDAWELYSEEFDN